MCDNCKADVDGMFDEWFFQIENYHLLAERFYEDLDAIRDRGYATNKDGNAQIANWLRAAFEAGYDAAIDALKTKTVTEHSDKYSDVVSDGGMDPRERWMEVKELPSNHEEDA